MQWFRVEMAPVASSITVLDTQRQLMYCIFEIDYKTVMEMHFHVCHGIVCRSSIFKGLPYAVKRKQPVVYYEICVNHN